MDSIRHHCGIVATADLSVEGKNVIRPGLQILHRLKHRGDSGGGIAFMRQHANAAALHIIKDLCTDDRPQLEDILPESLAETHAASVAIEHCRYPTSGPSEANLAHPLEYKNDTLPKRRHFAFGFNGTIANAAQLAKEWDIDMQSDTQVVLEAIRRSMARIEGYSADYREKIRMVFWQLEAMLDGAFNIVLLTGEGDLAVYRDRKGIHPLSYGLAEDTLVAASEDAAMREVYPNIQTTPLAPGSLLWLPHGSKQAPVPIEVLPSEPKHCYFEYAYFADPDSTLDGTSVRDARQKLGAAIAEADTFDDTYTVVPVLNSGLSAAQGYARQSGLKLRELIPIQRGYEKGRTFTTAEKGRQLKVDAKYDFEDPELRGAKIVLVDDSLVRGTTMRTMVERLREAGVAEIHLRLSCPPILAPCFYGIDFSHVHELLARKYAHEALPEGELHKLILAAIARDLNVDSVRFASVESVPAAIGKESRELCMACVTGCYPTATGQRLYNLQDSAKQSN